MNGPDNENDTNFLAIGIPLGAAGGVALGLVLMTIMDHPGFYALGVAIGLSLGTGLALALDLRR